MHEQYNYITLYAIVYLIEYQSIITGNYLIKLNISIL